MDTLNISLSDSKNSNATWVEAWRTSRWPSERQAEQNRRRQSGSWAKDWGNAEMHLQNRVTPFGEIVAISQRGMFTGNRGIVHDPVTRPSDQTVDDKDMAGV